MNYEEYVKIESERLGEEYRAALNDAEEGDKFWRELTSGQTVALTVDDILEADRRGTGDRAWRNAMAALDEWRAFREVHGAVLYGEHSSAG